MGGDRDRIDRCQDKRRHIFCNAIIIICGIYNQTLVNFDIMKGVFYD